MKEHIHRMLLVLVFSACMLPNATFGQANGEEQNQPVWLAVILTLEEQEATRAAFDTMQQVLSDMEGRTVQAGEKFLALRTLGRLSINSGRVKEALESYCDALQLYNDQPPGSFPEDTYARLSYSLGTAHRMNSRNEEAQYWIDEGLRYYRRDSTDPGMVVRGLTLKGETANYQSDYRRSIKWLTEALQICQKRDLPVPPNLYSKIGHTYTYLKEYHRSILFLRLALEGFQSEENPLVRRISQLYKRLGEAYHEQGDFRQSLEAYLRALTIEQEAFGDAHQRVAYTHNLVGSEYLALGLPDSALYYHKLSRPIWAKNLAPGARDWLVYDYFIGDAYLAMGETRAAERHFRSGLDLLVRHNGARHPSVASFNTKLARAAMREGRYEAAIALEGEALEILGAPRVSSMTYGDIAVFDAAMQSLGQRGKAFMGLFDQKGDKSWLDSALLHFEKGISLLDELLQNSTDQYVGQHAISDHYPFFEDAIRANIQAYMQYREPIYLQKAFGLSEKSKAKDLTGRLLQRRYQLFASDGDSLLAREEQLEAELEGLYFDRRKAARAGDKDRMASIDSLLLENKMEQSQWVKALADQLPDYHRLKYNYPTVDLKSLQEFLSQTRSCMLEYFRGEDGWALFVITPDTVATHWQAADSTQAALPLALWKQLSNWSPMAPGANAQRSATAALLAQAHDLLLPKDLRDLPPDGYSWIIVPDGDLQLLPFEVLLTEKPHAESPMNAWPYLLREKTISYAPSATLLLELQAKPPSAARPMAGFAANYHGVGTGDQALAVRSASDVGVELVDLPMARAEVETVTGLMGGRAYLGAESSEAIFKKEAGEYGLIHLAMHAFAEPERGLDAYLLISNGETGPEDGRLHAHELYQMQLQAELCVLSACNTGLGELRPGQGVQSLSLAFQRAGAGSTLMGLWKVPDRAAAELMEQFYKALARGMSKGEALAAAKLDYLQSHAQSGNDHPFFWAGFVLSGNPTAISVRSNRLSPLFPWLAGLTSLLVIGLAIGYYMTRKNKKRPQ